MKIKSFYCCHDKSFKDEKSGNLGKESMEEKAEKRMVKEDKRGKKKAAHKVTLVADKKPKKVIPNGGPKLARRRRKRENKMRTIRRELKWQKPPWCS